jgi:hypothetical protein
LSEDGDFEIWADGTETARVAPEPQEEKPKEPNNEPYGSTFVKPKNE